MSEAVAPSAPKLSEAAKAELEFEAALAKLPAHLRGVAIAGRDHQKAANDLKSQSKLDGVDRTQSIAEHTANAGKCAAQLKDK